jgi:hypothetical protein
MKQLLKVREGVAKVRRGIVVKYYGTSDQSGYVVTRGKQSVEMSTGIDIECSPTDCSSLANLLTKFNIIADYDVKSFQYLFHPLIGY